MGVQVGALYVFYHSAPYLLSFEEAHYLLAKLLIASLVEATAKGEKQKRKILLQQASKVRPYRFDGTRQRA